MQQPKKKRNLLRISVPQENPMLRVMEDHFSQLGRLVECMGGTSALSL